jgi:hypothetical protein
MGVTGHRGLADQLLPTPAALQAEVRSYAKTHLRPLGRRLLARHMRQRMNVRRGTFEDAIRARVSPVGPIRLTWTIDHPGADIQDRGGTIEAAPGKRLVFQIPGVGWRSATSVKLEARNFLSPALRDVADIGTVRLGNHIAGWLGGGR